MNKRTYVFSNVDFDLVEKFDTGFIEEKRQNSYLIFFLRANKQYELQEEKITCFDISLTGDRYPKKVCDRCYKCLPTEKFFENNRLKKDNIITKRPSCKSCRKIKNGKNISSIDRKKWEEKRPVNTSLFTCPICNKTTIVGVSKIVLDHNHHTGEVRGWLCESCNTGIGRFDDNIELIKRSILWLEKK